MIMDKTFSVGVPNTIIGIGAVQNLGTLVKKLGKKKVLIVTDKGIAQAGLVDQVKNPLEKEGIKFTIFDGCEPDAPVNVVANCAQFAKDNGCDLIIGVGGGSTMDISKIASIVATDDNISREIVSQHLARGVSKRGLPTILIPTTAGTGSEVSVAAVITDVDGCKRSVLSTYLYPEVAIVDPMMTLNLPAKVTADSGMDALSHAIEAYTNANANIFSEMFAGTTIKLVADNLRAAYCKGPQNLEARYGMAIAASNGSLAMSAAGGGILNHGMGYVIQLELHCTHGVSCTIMLPHVMEFNMLANYTKYARIAALMGDKVEGLSSKDAARKAVEAVRNLSLELDMPQRLRDIGIKKDSISRMADNLFIYCPRHLSNNPRNCSKNDAIKIFEAAW